MDSKNEKPAGITSYNIFEEIISIDNLFLSWKEFRKGKRKKSDVREFERNLMNNILKLHDELKNKTYQHSNYASFYIKDPKLRHIHKATVKDRVLHHAIFGILYSIFDKSFIFDSYSCRINKGTHKAVNRLNKFARKASRNNTKTCYVLKCDIKKFFDSIDHNILINLAENEIKDEDAIWLITKIIKSYSTKPDIGIPLGNITSQLFANIFLNKLDFFVKHSLKIKYYIRYCDDFVILSPDKIYLKNLVPIINKFLAESLKLSLHSGKIIIRKYNQSIDFLGYVIFPYHRVLRTKTKKRMFKRIRQKISDLKQGKISKKSFNQSIQSYLGLLKHCNSYKIRKEIINFILCR